MNSYNVVLATYFDKDGEQYWTLLPESLFPVIDGIDRDTENGGKLCELTDEQFEDIKASEGVLHSGPDSDFFDSYDDEGFRKFNVILSMETRRDGANLANKVRLFNSSRVLNMVEHANKHGLTIVGEHHDNYYEGNSEDEDC